MNNSLTLTYCANGGAIVTIPAGWAVPCGISISWPLTVHSLGAGQASLVILLGGQVIEGSRGTGVLVGVSGVQCTVVPSRTEEWGVVWCVGIAIVSLWTALTGLLIGQILVRPCWTSNGILCTFWAVVTSGALVTYDGVDGPCGALTVVQHEWVGFVHSRHAVVAIHTHTSGGGQIHTYNTKLLFINLSTDVLTKVSYWSPWNNIGISTTKTTL